MQASPDIAAAFLKGVGLHAFVCLPLLVGERLLGTLGFGRRWTDRFSNEDIRFLETVAAYVAIAKDRLRSEAALRVNDRRSEEHTSELQSLMRISYAVFCLKKTKT